MPTALGDLLREDGIKLLGPGPEHSCRCWNAAGHSHEDRSPSMSVNVEKGVFFCHACDIRGNAYEYLVKHRNLSPREAKQKLDGSGSPPQAKAPRPKTAKRPPRRLPDLPDKAVARHKYLDAAGKLHVVICRFDGKPKCLPYVPDGNGGWIERMPPGPHPLYNLKRILRAPPKHQITIVEGEKCADAMSKAFPRGTATCWLGGTNAAARTDWKPLYGRQVCLVSDADPPGRKCMERLAAHLAENGCRVRLGLAPGDDGADIADWIAAGGAQEAAQRIARILVEVKPESKKKSEYEIPEKPLAFQDNPFFRVLGNVDDRVAIMIASHRVLTFTRAELTRPSSLISIASIHFWQNLLNTSGIPTNAAYTIGSALLAEADQLGQVEPHRMIGRGLWRIPGGDVVWHLGDRLRLPTGEERPLDHYGSDLLAISRRRVAVGPDEPASDEELLEAAEAILAYRWRQRRDGIAFGGWLVSSLIGGALEWRPHLWLAAEAESGKSWLLKNIAKPFFGTDIVEHMSDVSSAGAARHMSSDSFPLLIDEAEPQHDRIEPLVEMVRISSGGDGMRVRATHNGYTMVQPRWSVMMSSTQMPNLSTADQTRFVHVQLGDRVEDWQGVREAILKAFTAERCRRMRARVFQDAPAILKAVESKVDILQNDEYLARMGARSAMIYGTLSACWQFFGATDNVLPESLPDKFLTASMPAKLLFTILALKLRWLDGDHSLGDLAADSQTPEKRKYARDHGILLEDKALLIDTESPALLEMLSRRNVWRNVGLRTTLKQIKEAYVVQHPRTFGNRRVRVIAIPTAAYKRLGISFSAIPEEESIL